MAPLKFYHFGVSPPSRCALLTIRNLKLDVEIILVDLMKGAHLESGFVKLNPQHTVPTIDDNGFILWESRAIATYLVSSRAPGSSLYPSDVKKRAVVDARLYLDQSLQLAGRDIMLPIHKGETTIAQDKKDSVYKLLENFNAFLEGKKYAAGDELTVADLALLSSISTLQYIGANLKKFSNVSEWYKRLEVIPGFDENEEGAKKLGQYMRSKISIPATWDD